MARDVGASGVIATNTTIGRAGLTRNPDEAGGLSGRPLWPLARQKIERVIQAAGSLPVIGVGGVERPDQVRDLLSAGCVAVQLYSAMIFRGPGLIARLNQGLAGTSTGTAKSV